MNKYSELLKELKIEIAANVLVEAKKSPVRIKDKGEVEEAIAEKGIDSKELSTAEMDKQSGRSRKEEEEFDTPDETLPDYDVAGEDLSLTQEEEEADAATAEEERTKSAMEAWQLNFPIKKKIKLDKMLTPHIATLKQEYLRREPNNSVIDETIKEIESVKKKLNAEFKLIKNPFDYYFEYEVDILTDELMLKKAFGATHTTLIDIDTTFAHDLKTYKIVRKSSVDKVIKHITDTISSKHKNEPEHFKTFIKDTVQDFIRLIAIKMFMDYTGYQHLQKSDKNKLFGYAIGHTHVNKTDENNKKVSEFKPIQTDKSDKDITKAFDTSLVDGDVDYSDVPTSIVYIFQNYIKDKYRVFIKHPSKQIAEHIKDDLVELKTDKQIKEEFISDGIGNFEKDVNYLISLIEDFLKTGEVNKETASFKKFFNLFKILKLTAHHKDHTGLISKGDESEDMINFKETEKFLEGCLDTDNALYNIETAPYMVSLTVQAINEELLHMKPLETTGRLDTKVIRHTKYINKVLDALKNVLADIDEAKEETEKQKYKKEQLKEKQKILEALNEICSKIKRENNSEYFVSLVEAMAGMLQGASEKHYISSVQGVFQANDLNELMRKAGVSDDKIERFTIVEDKDVKRAINKIASSMHKIYMNHDMCKIWLLNFLDYITTNKVAIPFLTEDHIVELYMNAVKALLEDLKTTSMFQHDMYNTVLMNEKLLAKIKTALIVFAKEKATNSGNLKTKIHKEFKNILFGKDNEIDDLELTFRITGLLNNIKNDIEVKGNSSIKEFYNMELISMCKAIYKEIENNSTEILFKIIDHYLKETEQGSEKINKFIEQQIEDIDKNVSKDVTSLHTLDQIEKDCKHMELNIEVKTMEFYINQMKADKDFAVDKQQLKANKFKQAIEQHLINHLYNSVIPHIDTIIDHLNLNLNGELIEKYQELKSKFKRKIVTPTDDKPLGRTYYVANKIKELKTQHSRKIHSYIDSKHATLNKQYTEQIPQDVERLSQHFGSVLGDFKDLRTPALKFNTALHDIIRYNNYTIKVLNTVNKFLESEKIQDSEFNEFIKILKLASTKGSTKTFKIVQPNALSSLGKINKPNQIQISFGDPSKEGIQEYRMFILSSKTSQTFTNAIAIIDLNTDSENNINIKEFISNNNKQIKSLEKQNTKLLTYVNNMHLLSALKRFLRQVIAGIYKLSEINDYFKDTKGFTLCL